MSGGGLFSDEDEDEGGGLFSAPAARPQAKADVKSKPKAKTTISLFDDDEQGEDEDFFAATVTTKATGYFQLSIIIIMMIHMYVLTWKLFWYLTSHWQMVNAQSISFSFSLQEKFKPHQLV